MTEDEYIKVSFLAKTRDMISILKQIPPGLIGKDEHQCIAGILYQWEEELSNSIEVKVIIEEEQS